MSVVVKGMEMPENCGKCPFLIEEDIDFDICRQCGAGKSGYIYEKDIDGFPSDCPLIALPDHHGRLGDLDALCEDLLKRWSVAETRKEELIKAVMADVVTPIIACQPTIIEAEDE